MPIFEIEQYEVHAQKYHVEAASEAEAIQKLFAGKGEPVDDGFDFIEVCDDWGLLTQHYPAVVDQLRSLGVPVGTAVIPCIRSIGTVK
jgi:hypothetical protein